MYLPLVRVGWIDALEFDQHSPPNTHPESPDRLEAIRQALRTTGLVEFLDRHPPSPVSPELLEAVHDRRYIQRLEALGKGWLDDDTYVGEATVRAARLAAGGVVDAVDYVLRGHWNRAFCSVRPPGHHAHRATGGGFCIFNNVAVGVRFALRSGRADRVAIVDFDAHHGDGTCEIFRNEPGVLYLGLHQLALYPQTGDGVPQPGSISVALPPGATDADALAAFERTLAPSLRSFAPDLIVLSAGFDGDFRDPLADLELTPRGFAGLTRGVVELADLLCEGRAVSVLEGGYDLEALAEDVAAHVWALLS